MTTTHHAHVIDHHYRDGYGRRHLDRPFRMVRCDTCSVMLNSGHHYSTADRWLAQRLADEHNAKHHGETA